MRDTITHSYERDVAPIQPLEIVHLRAQSSDILDALTPPDRLRKVRSMIQELARLKKMQRRRVQVLLIHHTMRRMVQQPRILSIPVEPENRRLALAAPAE